MLCISHFPLEEEKYTVVIIKPDAVAIGKVEEIKQTVSKTFVSKGKQC